MTETNTNHTFNGISRRAFLAMTGGALALASFPALALSDAWRRVDEINAVVGDADPIAQGVNIELPLVTENGANVPLKVGIGRPMAEGEHVTAIHIYAPRNPFPEIATFRFVDGFDVPEIETRIRLNESQTVFVVAELNSGAVLMGERDVRVTVSGCLTQADTYAADSLFETRVRVAESVANGTPLEVLTLINHPQETGLREDAQGNPVPKRLIERLEARYNGEVAFVAEFNRSISSNPYLRFFITPEESGALDLVWTEDTGASAQFNADITVG
ncbi:thiosulfate oxidation carrier protein SoxY [Pelagibacterium limicola]|uniref:thiosulfate oxidation carrier protein SoxY n=1 Tax=Pelagibacterium limicola TaxID=2791022 RepID=UPI0018B0087E|nr:thiosulfate oxidation carrier protein SoxY [Pelagibacterium limicola]